MPPKRRRRFQGLYYHSSPPKVLPMNGQVSNSNGRRKWEPDDFSVKLSTIRIWMHEKDIGKLTRVLWAGQGTRLRQQASTNPKVKRFLAAVPYVMNSIKDVHQAVIDNNLETLQTHLEPPVPPALVTCRDANGLNLIHKAAGLGHATILEYLITTWPDGVHETDITGKTPLHWAASAKNNMRCYTLLTQAGCDEEAVDYKMKTPSYYRHKPNEIERAFLTYVPEAPRVSPEVSTDWEALSDDSGDGKKLDIKIPEMNGFGRHSNAESNENASEAEGASQEDEDMSKDGDAAENDQEPADDKLEEEEEPSAEENEIEADEKEPEPEAEPEPEPEHDPEPEQEQEPETTEAASEEEEEPTHEPEENKEENEEDSNKDQTNETEDQNEKQPQQQTENLNESTENLTKDTPVAEIEKDGKSTEENMKENKEMGEEKSDKDNETGKEKPQDTEESKESVEHSEDIKETSSTESTDKEKDSNKEMESKDADHMEQITENDKEHDDKEKDQSAGEMETKEIQEQEKGETPEETKTEKESNEKEIKENTVEPSAVIESKEMKEQQIEEHETSEQQKTMDGNQDKLVDDKKSQEENVITKSKEEIKNEKEHDAEVGKDLEENKTNDKEENKEHDKEQDAEVEKSLKDNKMNANDNAKEDIKDDKDVEKNGHGIVTKVEEEEEENYKTVSEALENIKEEVKDNVKYLANQIQNLFNSDSDSETKEKDDKEQEQENDQETKEPATQGDTGSNQDETKDKTMENKTEVEKLKENEIEKKNDETKESSITNDFENKTEQTTESSTSKLNTNEIKTTTKQAQSTIESAEIKQNTETPKTPQDQQTTAKAIEQSQTAIASDKQSSAEETPSTSDKPSSAKQTPSTSDKPSSAKQTPSTSDKPNSAQQKTPKKETEKTEEDENNNNNSKNNDNIAHHKETTDSEYQELNQALEQYKKEEKEEKEKEKEKEKEQEQEQSSDLVDKLEDMADNVKENVKEMADKVKNIFSSNDNAIDKQETEASDVVVHAVDASKLNGIKTNEKSMESSDDTGDEDEDPEKHTENTEDNKQENENNTEEPEPEAAENDETTEEQQETETQQQETETELEAQADDKPPAEDAKNEEEFVADEDSSPTPSLAIEGFVQGDAEDNTVQSQTAAFDHDDDDKESRIQSIIASGDMEQLAQIVLNGDGQKLLNVEATEPEIQAFLRNVPNYMNKIRRVHEAARGGSLLNLQQALDRRKFAVAKDEISSNGATPLHVAVLFGHSDIVRYLSARFPETTTITDNDGRTPLHYAAVISDNGHFYNVLLQLGANPKLADKLGHTPEDYLSKDELKDTLNYGQLLKNFNAEELEQQLLSDQGQIENHSIQENPIFKTEQGKYLADNLADPLIKALTQVAQKRPSDPLQYLTNYLQNYAATRNTNGRTITQAAIHTGSSQTNSTILANSKSSTPPVQQQQQQQQQLLTRHTMHMNGHVRHDNSDNIDDNDAMQRIEEYNDADNADNDDDGNDSEAEISRKLEERDEHGQSMLHFACARSHRKGGLIHLIEESKADITYRDELYRTARDVALQANQLGNAKEIDRYLMSLAIVGDIKPFEHFAINGYDHIIDVLDDDETPIIDVVASRGQNELAQYLRSVRPLEELREELHQMIRENNVERVKEIANGPNGRWLIKAKNYYGRTALHIAILKESIEIVEMFVKIAPEALKIGDNLERTPLHYGMGTNIFENISRILIQSGAKRTYKDLKGRQPSYYFMNKADILRLQEEEDENR